MSAHTSTEPWKRSNHGCCADKACTEKTCMQLPQGKKCGDCVHAYRCSMMFGHGNMDTYCDWFPRRFHEKAHILEQQKEAP
jgi:hypothetical protein